MDWKSFIKDYWPVVATLLAGIGYLINRIFSKRDKEKDLKAEQRKIFTEQYYSTYNAFESILKESVYDAIERKLSTVSVQKIADLSLQYKIALERLSVFEKKSNMSIYFKIATNLQSLNGTLATYCSSPEYYNEERNDIDHDKLNNNLLQKMRETLEENGRLQLQIVF